MENNKDFFNVQTSILLGALIISGSLLYSAKIISGGSQNLAAVAAVSGIKVEARKDAPSEGSGKVTVVEFSDFQCPFCKSFWSTTYKDLKTKYIDTGKITFIYRHFPLSNIHQNAEKAAEAGECAGRQGKFFEYHDILFSKSQSDGKGLNVNELKSYAVNLGLDTARFNTCLDGGEATAVVAVDQAEGQRVGVTGTPSFVVNGKLIVGAEKLSAFEQAIDTALKK